MCSYNKPHQSLLTYMFSKYNPISISIFHRKQIYDKRMEKKYCWRIKSRHVGVRGTITEHIRLHCTAVEFQKFTSHSNPPRDQSRSQSSCRKMSIDGLLQSNAVWYSSCCTQPLSTTHYPPYATNYVCSSVRVRWNCMWAECDISVKVVIFHPHWWRLQRSQPQCILRWNENGIIWRDLNHLSATQAYTIKYQKCVIFYLFGVLYVMLSIRRCIDASFAMLI